MTDLASPLIVKAVGVSFCPGYPGTLHRLHELLEYQDTELSDEGPTIILRRVPDNPHDTNCIELHCPAVDRDLGRLPREIAALVAEELDSGGRWLASVAAIRINSDHPDRPGLDVRLERIR